MPVINQTFSSDDPELIAGLKNMEEQLSDVLELAAVTAHDAETLAIAEEAKKRGISRAACVQVLKDEAKNKAKKGNE